MRVAPAEPGDYLLLINEVFIGDLPAPERFAFGDVEASRMLYLLHHEDDSYSDDYVRCPDLHDPNAFAVRVVGDSMEPKFFEGDIVIFSPSSQINSGDDCFVRLTTPHETTFKRVFFELDNTVRLQPRNEKYPPTTIDGNRINGLYRAAIRYERL